MGPSESMYVVKSISRSLQTQPGRDTENDAGHVISNNIDVCLSDLPKSEFLALIKGSYYFWGKEDGYQPINFLALF